jgi:hypothetical protein
MAQFNVKRISSFGIFAAYLFDSLYFKLKIHWLKWMQKMPNETIITINRRFSRPSAELLKPFSDIPVSYLLKYCHIIFFGL